MGGGTMRQPETSGTGAVAICHSRRRRCAAVVVPALLVTACTSHRTPPVVASPPAATSSPVAVAPASSALPSPATAPPTPTGQPLPPDLSARVSTVDPWLPGGQLARCLQTTPDGTQLLCESLTAGVGGSDPMTAMIALDVRTKTVTVLRHNLIGEQSDVVESVDADSTWVVCLQSHDV